jgi:hypothetical protein
LQKALPDCAVHRRGIDGRMRGAKSTADSSPVPSAAPRKIDECIGRWNGLEGTYLEISKSGDTYEIRIKDLDKVQTYRGTATSDGISFKRNGQAETIRSGNGERTGMKWLADKRIVW